MNVFIRILFLTFISLIFLNCINRTSLFSVEIPADLIEVEESKPYGFEEEPPIPTRAEIIIKTLMTAYPDKIEKVEYINDDWAFFLNDAWYYYAGGRLLPESELENSSNYRAMTFYNYPAELPEWVERTPSTTNRTSSTAGSNSGSSAQRVQTRRSNFFLDTIWNSGTQRETENQLVRFNFLGKQTRVHKDIHERLVTIETQIRAAAQTDQEIQTWINSIYTQESYNWRNIALTANRSYHSYGLAIDFLPRSLGRLQTYWLWSSQSGRDWRNIPYTERYHPPAPVIKIFETYGFIWGGKWMQFDTMHFEYRPELLILSGFTVIGLND